MHIQALWQHRVDTQIIKQKMRSNFFYACEDLKMRSEMGPIRLKRLQIFKAAPKINILKVPQRQTPLELFTSKVI